MEDTGGKVYRLGVMGGTFDPIHYGHLVAAETARIEFRLRQVLFVPTGNPPHKQEKKISPGELRFEMVRRAVADNPNFSLSRLEIERQGPSYTIDTLRILRKDHPESDLYFITGTDALREIFFWHEAAEILKLTNFVAVSRPGYEARDFLEQARKEHPEAQGRISLLEVPALAISSTDVRARVGRGQSIRYLLPEAVRRFIEEKALYRMT
ncbi:nicotinate-nucleotide adenylyltransferase [Acididesulfobacillus acetoxydans]|nr:nicotinate-nucleotide adenylyltransferase [Acididesulfobacillus acetoxydans]